MHTKTMLRKDRQTDRAYRNILLLPFLTQKTPSYFCVTTGKRELTSNLLAYNCSSLTFAHHQRRPGPAAVNTQAKSAASLSSLVILIQRAPAKSPGVIAAPRRCLRARVSRI